MSLSAAITTNRTFHDAVFPKMQHPQEIKIKSPFEIRNFFTKTANKIFAAQSESLKN